MFCVSQVYYPSSVQIPAVRQVPSYQELNNALNEVRSTSFVDTLTARTSWILKPAEVRLSVVVAQPCVHASRVCNTCGRRAARWLVMSPC